MSSVFNATVLLVRFVEIMNNKGVLTVNLSLPYYKNYPYLKVLYKALNRKIVE